MKDFITRHYQIKSEKLSGTRLRFAFLTDLHGLVFGEENEDLISAIYRENPDLILTAGDMLKRNDAETCESAETLLGTLAKKFPVYYTLGNHEYKHFIDHDEIYMEYEKRLEESGVRFLHNQSVVLKKNGKKIRIYGLELPLEYYRKPFPLKLSVEDMQNWIGETKEDCFHILLAHNPIFGRVYMDWGADLILSGHYHGGLVRFSENIGLLSSFGHPFPKYCCGKFERGPQNMLVSAGLGEHSVPIRIHNPRELLIVTCE